LATMRTIIKLAIGVGAVWLAFRLLSSGEGPFESHEPIAVPPEQAYALRPENTWPPLPDSVGQTPDVTANLLTVSYYVVLDGSGSMSDVECSAGQRKIDSAREALTSFAVSVPPDANLGLASFETRGLGERVPLATDNREVFARAVQQVSAGGGTPLRSAIDLAYEKLEAQARRQLGYGEYHLVVVTDGIASEGQDPTRRVNEILAESPVVVHTIGFCIGTRHSLNQPGRTYYRAADNLEALRRGLDEVLAEAPSFDLTDFKQ
jgi:Ca-activated chloride channel family protein